MSDTSPGSLHWQRAFACPSVSGQIKQQPEDFQVVEQLGVLPSGEGEHIWLSIRKTKQNTDQVARQIARFAAVGYRDVGYSGLKDYHAVTSQWFSVWKPKGAEPDWSKFEFPGVEILESKRHNRKIKRGTHSTNKFNIRISQLSGDLAQLDDKLKLMAEQGVPNYFGEQRFGRDGNNVQQAQELLSGATTVKNKNHRGLLISAARSWIFNKIVSSRVEQGTWRTLMQGEPANLDGSASIFASTGAQEEQARLALLDIHPTAAMWGVIDDSVVQAYPELHKLELQIADSNAVLSEGLVKLGLKYQRRPIRLRVQQFSWDWQDQQLLLSFCLQRGQFATSVLRELVSY